MTAGAAKRILRLGIAAILVGATTVPEALEAQASAAGAALDVVTFNVWHGRRSGESKKVFPGESAERKERRFAWQIEEIRRLDPDVLLLQEVNPNQREARRYARALGYDEIHKVTSCGLHLGKLYKIPRNVNEGLAILAKPELGLRRAGVKRLSGNAWCTASFGFQTRESRFALFGEIRVDGRPVLLVSTHLFSPAFMPPGFRDDLERLVEGGVVEPEHASEITELLDARSARNVREIDLLLREIERHRKRIGSPGAPAPVILGGDLNTEPATPGVARLHEGGLESATAGREIETWDPEVNQVNYETGTKKSDPFDTRGVAELIELLEPRSSIARQIDYLFVSPDLSVAAAGRALDRPRDEIYPSDHFALLATVRLP